jgi:iron complex transport system ATP-binding protein
MMITHHVEEVLPQFERALLIGEGRIVAAGSTGEVVTAASLAKTYGVSVAQLVEQGGRRWPIWG